MKKKFENKCPMCGRQLDDKFLLKCNYCHIVFAIGEITKQEKSKLCIYGVNCTIKDFFTKKLKKRIFCKKFKWFVNPEFCKRVCYYWTPRGYKLRPYKIYA